MKINLRDLFWVIFVVAVLTMWWVDRAKLAERLRLAEAHQAPGPFDEDFPSGFSVLTLDAGTYSARRK